MRRWRFFFMVFMLGGLWACTPVQTVSTPASPVLVVGGIAYQSMIWQARLSALPAGMSLAELQHGLQDILDAADQVLSTYRADSELMRVNRAPVGEWVIVSPLLLNTVHTAVEISVLTDGAYDITVGPLVDIWGFGSANVLAGLPDETALAAARARVGWRHIGIRAETSALMRRADIQMDISSMGEGIAVDALSDFLRRKGVQSYLVSVAGTLRAQGKKPDGQPWTVAIERPDGSGLPLLPLPLQGQVVSTSGSYRHYREISGQTYSHTLDPESGRPVTHQGVSVTVLGLGGMTAARADALATALNVLGPEAGLRLAEEQGLAVLFIEKAAGDFRELASSGFRSFLFYSK